MAMEPLIVCLDVDYRDDHAVAAGVWFRGWEGGTVECEHVAVIQGVADYQPGEFYRRELPCLSAVLAKGPAASIILIDGYVTLGGGRPGLGMHLYAAMGERIPVVGIAKTRFHAASEAVAVRHGGSDSPLYVTAVGIDAESAADAVKRMHGEYRLPTMVKKVDRLARDFAIHTP